MRRSVTEPAAARARDPPGLAIIDLDRSTGLDVDGVNTPLDGEPSIAHSNGWGNLSFLTDHGRGN